ncbi:MAG: DUF2196 domain-containing protein [Micavibrio sp.]
MGIAEKGQNLKPGMTVEVSLRSDRAGQELVQGVISEILTRKDYHPHGILVKLESGVIGRVKRVIGEVGSTAVDALSSSNNVGSQPLSLADMICFGENHRVEFKDRALWSVTYSNEDIQNHRPQTKELHAYGRATSKVIVAKILASFLNTNGGTLIIGVQENKDGAANEIVGIEQEFPKLKDQCQDGYRRMIVDLIKDYFPSNIFNHLENYFRIDFEDIGGRTVCGIVASRSDKRVFLKLKGNDHFFIRTDASTRELTGEEVVDYCQTRFS